MMLEAHSADYYEVLEITPDASQQDIRSAYLRAKSAYKKDSVALYSLISEEETESHLSKIEEAYQILSNPEKRKEYDKKHGNLTVDEVPIATPSKTKNIRHSKVISIDRVPPMEKSDSDTSLLIPPVTDFSMRSKGEQTNKEGLAIFRTDEETQTFLNPFGHKKNPPSSSETHLTPNITKKIEQIPISNHQPLFQGSPFQPQSQHPPSVKLDDALQLEIDQETEYRGLFLRKIREAKNISIEEVAEYTKITRTYIIAIEEENFSKLPAPVYLRGFVSQVAKYLKLPPEKVATAYMSRYRSENK